MGFRLGFRHTAAICNDLYNLKFRKRVASKRFVPFCVKTVLKLKLRTFSRTPKASTIPRVTYQVIFSKGRLTIISSYQFFKDTSVEQEMRNLGHEKKSQHVLITSVILRQSFLSAMKKIISTRTVGMCPCSYF